MLFLNYLFFIADKFTVIVLYNDTKTRKYITTCIYKASTYLQLTILGCLITWFDSSYELGASTNN